jgi:glycosyltransferase involved in cell wall biosynthesis
MISVIVPAKNEEKFIGKCLESLKKQHYNKAYEIIVVDGGSTDKTREVAKKYADKIFTHLGKGPGRARNYGAKKAKYEIVAFTDADCIVSPYWLSRIEKSIKGDTIAVGGIIKPYKGLLRDKIMFKINSDWWVRLSTVFGIYQLYGNSCAYRKDKFLEIGGFDTKISFFEDTDLSMRIKKLGRIAIDKHMWIKTSTRRFRQMGYAKLFWINMMAFYCSLRKRPIKTQYFGEIKH